MTEFAKFHKIITASQVTIATISLCLSSLGIVIKHPFLIYFWYLALSSIAMILATSFLIAVFLVLNRLLFPRSARRGHELFSQAKGARV
jgi:hypothetical protein